MIQNEDQYLKEFFSDYQPELSDNAAFMKMLDAQLDKVEYIKAIQEAQVHRYKMAVVGSLVCGILVGSIFGLMVLRMPMDVPLFKLVTTNAVLLFIQHYSRLIAVVILSFLICWGIIGIVNGIQELCSYRDKDLKPIHTADRLKKIQTGSN